MKRKNLFLAIFFVPLFAYSQIRVIMNGGTTPPSYETLDASVFRVFYEFDSPSTFMMQKEDSAKRKDKDFMVLEIGEKGISKFFSDNKRRMDSLLNEMIKINPSNINITKDFLEKNGVSSGGSDFVVYKNYPEGKMTIMDFIVTSNYLYEEDLNEIQWQISSDTMTCLKYLCQKASCDFRGRHYDAWFASDLPINDGPWKFMGLPGLILNVSDSDSLFTFKAVGLENSVLPIQIPKQRQNYMKASRKEIAKVKKRSVEDPMGFIKDANPGSKIDIKIKDDEGNEKRNEEIHFIYNPIELE
ncbi:MAG: GLPGLI family protein [Tannerella sp.]|jgi:GLPGLI family protein|nr:GLPGLI family protein [Tannerella sp.]